MATADSSALIWLAKAGAIRVLRDLYGEIHVPKEVYNEGVVRGLEDGYPDAHLVEGAAGEGWLKVHSPSDTEGARQLVQRTGLHAGEAAAILLASELGTPLLIDEREGRAVARAMGVRTAGSLSVILSALRLGHITKDEARGAVDAMVRKGFWVEPTIIVRIHSEIDNYSPKASS